MWLAPGRGGTPFNLLWGCAVDFQKSPSSGLIWRGMKDFSYLIGTSFRDPKMGRCA